MISGLDQRDCEIMNDVPSYGRAKTIDFKDIPIIDV